MNLKRVGIDTAILGIPLLALLYFINQWNLLIDRSTSFHDYWGIFWQASAKYGLKLWLGEISVLGEGSFGSAAMLKYAPWGFVLVLGLWIGQTLWRKYRNEESYWYFWSNGLWAAYGCVWIFAAIGFSAVGHYLDLYSLRVTCPDGSVLSLVGSVDWITHLFSPSIFAVTLLMVSWYDIFKWKGRTGRFKEAIWILTLVMLLSFIWEIGETGNPTVYRNLYWDSLKDLFMGFFGAVFNIAVYNLAVPFE